jgi:hypothetical protein
LILGLVHPRPGQLSFVFGSHSLMLSRAQDNAGKTTLLYRLKVRTAIVALAAPRSRHSRVRTDRRSSDYRTDNRIQRRERDLQEPKFQRVGVYSSLPLPLPPLPLQQLTSLRISVRSPLHSLPFKASFELTIPNRRPNLNPSLLALLLRQHRGSSLRSRRDGPCTAGNSGGRAKRYAERGGAAGCRAARIRE